MGQPTDESYSRQGAAPGFEGLDQPRPIGLGPGQVEFELLPPRGRYPGSGKEHMCL